MKKNKYDLKGKHFIDCNKDGGAGSIGSISLHGDETLQENKMSMR